MLKQESIIKFLMYWKHELPKTHKIQYLKTKVILVEISKLLWQAHRITES